MVRPPSNTKRKLIDAAHALVWASSYTQVSVDDICRAAGVQKGSFYHFFKSKSDLTIATLEDCWQDCRAELDAFAAQKRTARAQLKEICRLIHEEQKEWLDKNGIVCGCPYALVAAEAVGENKELASRAEKMSELFIDYLEVLLKAAAKEGLIPTTDLKRRAREMHIFIKGSMMLARLTNSLRPVGRDLEKALLHISGIELHGSKSATKR